MRMKKSFGLVLIWLVACLMSFKILAMPLSLSDANQSYTAQYQIHYLLTDDDLSAEQALKREKEFQRHTLPTIPNLGYSEKNVWILLDIENLSALNQWIMEFGYYPPQIFDLYLYNSHNQPIAFSQQEHSWPSRYLAYSLTIDQDLRILIRLKSNASLTLPLTFSSAQFFTSEKQGFYFAQALYFGWVISLTLYNLFLFFSFRDARFGYYVLFSGSLTAALAFYYGFPQEFLQIPYSDLTTIIGTSLFNLAIIFAIAFTRKFLNTPSFMPISDKILLGITAIFWLSIFTVILQPENIASSWILSAGAPVFTLMTIVMAFFILLKGHKQARYFLIAWTVLLIATTIGAARNFGWIETNFLTTYAIQIGSAIEILLLAIALTDSMKIEREQHEKTQAKSLEQSLEQSGLLRKNQAVLQTKIQDRTQNIHQSISKVQSAFKTYMRFGAMISHEFKNPLNAIINQIETMKIEQEHGIDQSQKRLTIIESQTARLRNLFEHWLSTDQLINGQLSIEIKSVKLQAWLSEVKELIQAIHPDQRFSIQSELDDKDVANMDATLIQVGIFNLVDNACQYSKPGSVIHISAKIDMDELWLTVRNPPATTLSQTDLNECLNPYYRITSNQHKSTGLGLSLVKLICQVHQGELIAEVETNRDVVIAMCLNIVETHERSGPT